MAQQYRVRGIKVNQHLLLSTIIPSYSKLKFQTICPSTGRGTHLSIDVINLDGANVLHYIDRITGLPEIGHIHHLDLSTQYVFPQLPLYTPEVSLAASFRVDEPAVYQHKPPKDPMTTSKITHSIETIFVSTAHLDHEVCEQGLRRV